MVKKQKTKARRKLHVRTGDTVTVIAGNDLGVRGEVLRTMPGENKVVVENVNVHYVHEKAGQRGRRQGERVEKEMPVDASNVMLICQNRECERYGRTVRVGRRRQKDGGKARVCVQCENPIGSE